MKVIGGGDSGSKRGLPGTGVCRVPGLSTGLVGAEIAGRNSKQERKPMSKIIQILGLDVHQETLAVFIAPDGMERKRRAVGLERGCVRSASRSRWIGFPARPFIDSCGSSATLPRSGFAHNPLGFSALNNIWPEPAASWTAVANGVRHRFRAHVGFFIPKRFARPKAPSSLRFAGALQNLAAEGVVHGWFDFQ